MSQIVVNTQTIVNADGSTTTITTYSDGSVSTDVTPAPGSGGANQATLQSQARTALVNNRTYTGLASPSTAQNTAQIKALSQQMNGVIRLLLGQLDATN